MVKKNEVSFGDIYEAVNSLTEHVHVLREAIDELRSSIQWGLQNDKFRSPEY